MLKDIPSNVIEMLTSKDREMQRLGITLLGYKETKEHLNELNKMLAEYKIQILRRKTFTLNDVYSRKANHMIQYDKDGLGEVINPVKRNEKDYE
jgi:NADPH:quinone reductase-like Zn-dependent oxidoreductase